MSFYRVSLLDPEGVVADSRTTDSIADAAKLMIAHAEAIGEPWTDPLLDADGELTVQIKGPADRDLTPAERDSLAALLEEFGASNLTDGSDRWTIPDDEETL